jgi:hypothetical protein
LTIVLSVLLLTVSDYKEGQTTQWSKEGQKTQWSKEEGQTTQ